MVDLLIRNIGLVNKMAVMIIPTAVNAFYLLVMKNAFSNFPENLEEAAKIDGANDLYILVRIIVPLSAPIIATFTLFFAVDRWNEWFHAMLFISGSDKQPLQLVLRQMVVNLDMSISSPIGRIIQRSTMPLYPSSVQMAVVVVAMIPIAMIYPFLQKHFTKGILIGSLKG